MENSTSKEASGQQSFGIPVAIVLAGGLVALAIYFGGTGSTPGSNSRVAAQPAGHDGAAGAAQPAAVPVVGEARAVDDNDYVKGATNPKVTIIEYSDFECPFCKRFHPTVEQIIDEYPNDVAWVYRHLPLESIHPNARLAANAAECAGAQGAFWEFTDYVFANTSSGADIAEAKLPELAAAAGVPNAAAFSTCLEDRTFDDNVAEDIADAQAAGGRGTPYSIVIGPDGEQQALSGAQPYESVKATVDALLAG